MEIEMTPDQPVLGQQAEDQDGTERRESDSNQVFPEEEPTEPGPPEQSRKEKIITWVKIGIFIAIILFLIIFIAVESEMVGEWLEGFLTWVEDSGVLGMFVFMLVYVVATVCFVPGLILTLGAGFIFTTVYGTGLGIFIGTVVVFVGATIGSICAFLLGRYVFRESLQAKVSKYPKFIAIEDAIQEQGLKLTFLLRLSPLIPFNVFNYFMGITSVKFREYAFASPGMLPGTIAYVYFGSALGSVSEAASGSFEGGDVQLGLLIGGSVLAIVAVCYVSYVAKKKINSIIDRKKQEKEDAENEEEENHESGPSNSDQGSEAGYEQVMKDTPSNEVQPTEEISPDEQADTPGEKQ